MYNCYNIYGLSKLIALAENRIHMEIFHVALSSVHSVF